MTAEFFSRKLVSVVEHYQGNDMNVFDEIRADLESLSDVELRRIAEDQYGLEVDVADTRATIVDRCLAVEQHNCYA